MGTRKNRGVKERKNANVNYLGLIVIPIVAIVFNLHPIKTVKSIYHDIIQTDYRPNIVGVNQSELTLFKADLSPKRAYESKKMEPDHVYYNSVENTIWVDNQSDKSLKITDESVLEINSIEKLTEEARHMTTVIGIKDEKLIVYVVNNTCNTYDNLDFSLISTIDLQSETKNSYINDDEMTSIFNTDRFQKNIITIAPGSIVKLFEFKLSKQIENYPKRNYFEVGIREGTKNKSEQVKDSYTPFVLSYQKEKGFNFYYSGIGGGGRKIPRTNNPHIFLDIDDKEKQSYGINMDSELKSQETIALTQYIIPNRSCKINYTIKLKANGKMISDKKLSKIETTIVVPYYNLDISDIDGTKRFFEALSKDQVEFADYQDYNLIVNKEFRYKPREWFNSQLEKDSNK